MSFGLIAASEHPGDPGNEDPEERLTDPLQRASCSESDPTIAVVELSLTDLGGAEPSNDGAASLASAAIPLLSRDEPTVAMPRGAAPSREVSEEIALVTGDYAVVARLEGAAGGEEPPRPRARSRAADPLLGMVVADRYRILGLIGRGGMGTVYKVQHTRIGKLLAMKLLSGELSQSPEAVRRFKREALTVSRLQSPNTVQVFDYGVSDGLTYLVMELVPGQTLGDVARAAGPLPFARAARIVVQVLSSLAEAHAEGIVHRDIKPDNVMLAPGEGGADVAKVLDFGLAKLREADVGEVTCQGVILGTPSYMSPEQIRGEPVDPRSDVYSAGALLYRLLVGQVPFRADTAISVLSKHLHEIPVPPAERAPHLGIPPGVSRAVMRALRKDPDHRFQRAEDFRAVLVEELRSAGSQSVDNLLDPGRLPRLAWSGAAPATRDDVDAYERKLRRKRYGAAATFGAVVLGAAALGAGALVPREPARRGVEIEPNNTAAEATPLSLGQPITGTLGKRLDDAHGDRDFYVFDLPGVPEEPATLRLRVGALRSVALCAMLYRPGFAEAVGQYCVGRPGRDLVIPALTLPPGRYLLAVLQDLDPHGGPAPYVQECISDTYTILAESVRPEPDAETEPNDTLAAATRVALGRPVKASIAWARDEDVFCVSAAVRGPIRFRLRAAYREGGVLEATPLRAGAESGAVWIHADEASPRHSGEPVSPWLSDVIPAGDGERCLRVRLAADPRARDRVGGGEAYVVEAEPSGP